VKKHLLVRQRDLTDCGAACVASVCAYFESYVPVSRIRQLAGTDKYGTSILGIVQAAGKLGMDAKAVMVPFDSLTGIDLPAIVHVIINEKINHFIVITMINKHAVIAMDPADGKFREISNLDFKKIWKGITVTLKPGPAFKKYKRISTAG
jgi:ABC-type bacteriocin/lantibiotic exporter with double-glycine peptidase domain